MASPCCLPGARRIARRRKLVTYQNGSGDWNLCRGSTPYVPCVSVHVVEPCAPQHWLNAVLGLIVMGLLYNDMCRQENSNLERFGDDYQRCMECVPRMNLVAGTIRLMENRN
jgi:hypothetical protein